jgi:phage head maturation protease
VPTRAIDERKFYASGFRLVARNIVQGQSLWRRDDDPDRTYTDDEAVVYLAEHEKTTKKGKELMQRLEMKAQTTATDVELGTFRAVVSSWSADREGDVIDPSAFDQSLADWRSSGKHLPLLYEHSHVAIGSLDPHSAITDERGLTIDGEVDREEPEGRRVWKQIKRGRSDSALDF